MIDAFVKKEDILKLIFKSEKIDGLIEKYTFIRELNKLKEYKKPKPKNRVVYLKDAILEDIETYRKDVNMKPKYKCVWEFDEKGGIRILEVEIIPSQFDSIFLGESNIYLHVCNTKTDAAADATIEELHKAVENYTGAGYL